MDGQISQAVPPDGSLPKQGSHPALRFCLQYYTYEYIKYTNWYCQLTEAAISRMETTEVKQNARAPAEHWLSTFRLLPADFAYVGRDLRRPECVLALKNGDVLASDKDGAVSVISPDGRQSAFGQGLGLPNTFTLDGEGRLLVADLKYGAVLRLDAEGKPATLYDSWQGIPLGSVNFMLAGEEPDVVWFSVSTRNPDYRTAIEKPVPDGCIFRMDRNGLSLVADGLFFPNAMQIDAERNLFYAVETTIGAVSRAKIRPDGTLGPFSRFGPAPLYAGAYTDGLALDDEGNVWLTELSRNAILVLDTEGRMHTVFEDLTGAILNKPTGLAFGGDDQKTVFVGSLKMDTLPCFRSPVAGHSPRLWRDGAKFSASH